MWVLMDENEKYLNRDGDYGPLTEAALFSEREALVRARLLGLAIFEVDTPAAASLRNYRAKHALRQAGFALIMEMLMVCGVLLVLAAIAIPNVVQIRAGANQQQARTQIMMVYNAHAAGTICAATPGCVPSPALSALIPAPGTITSAGYIYTYTPGDTWTYSAVPVSPGFSGHAIYTANTAGFACTIQGAPC